MKITTTLAGAAALLAFCGCRSAFQDYELGGLRAPVHYFAERPLEAGGDEETAIVMVHGYGDGVELPAEVAAFREEAGKWCREETEMPYVIAPMFPTLKTMAKFKCEDDGRAHWNDSIACSRTNRCSPNDDWRGGGDADNAPGLSSFDVTDRIFAELARRFPKLRRVILTGFSAGGQYSDRYAAVGKGLVREGVTVEYAPLAPSTWLKPDSDDPWHYGLAQKPRYSSALSRKEIFKNLTSRRQWCGCGELDVKQRPYTSLDIQPEAARQGTNRYERFLSHRAYVRQFPTWNGQCSFHTFRGIGHAAPKAYASTAFIEYALGVDTRFNDGYPGRDLPSGISIDERLSLSAERLTGRKYRPDRCFLTEEQSWGWPGDTEGRLLLALVMQWQATGKKAANLDEILRLVPTHLNERGYRGNIDDDVIREQQLFGNSWLMRALCAYAAFAKDPVIDARAIAVRMAENLYLPCTDKFPLYPITAAERTPNAGGGIGSEDNIVNGWQLSTDVGAAFSAMDGVTAVYELTGDERFRPLLDAAAARFAETDVVALQAQTHATLTTCRWLLRYDQRRYLPLVERVFATYRECGMTESAANYNWFGRFDVWTEPCAIVDSLIVCDTLAKLTKHNDYAELAERIFAALCKHQRDNGGFGLQKTFPKGVADPGIVHTYEAHWCCTMRGAAGLAWAKMNGYR